MNIHQTCLLTGLYILLLFCSQITTAQVIRTNERGERIIVHPDGTIQPYTMFSLGEEPEIAPEDVQNTGPKKYPIFDGSVAAGAQRISVTEADLARIAERRAQISKDAAQVARVRADEASRQRRNIESQLVTVGNRDKERKRQLSIQLDAAKNIETETAREATQARAEADQAQLFSRGGAFIDAFIAEREASKKRSRATVVEHASKTGNTSFPIPFGPNYSGLVTPFDATVNPPTETCRIAFEGNDESTGRWRRDLEKQLLFTHTDERLRVYLKDKAYLRCEAFLTSLGGGFQFLTLQFSFAYPNAREAYGIIEKGSVLTIKMLNGQFVNLRSGAMDKGSYDLKSEILTYRVHYPIDRSQSNILRKSEVDTVLVFWSSGYEEYEVYNMDFFMKQLKCLDD